jgi:acetyl-CoA carboxylase biotin carboxyl carrier protein
MNKTRRKTSQSRTPVEKTRSQKPTPATEQSTGEAPVESPLGEDVPGLDQIKELIELVAAKDFNEFELQRGGFRLRLQRGLRVAETVALPVEAGSAPAASAATSRPEPASAAAVEESLHIVTSPIVGTFYSSPSPSSPTFADIGDLVQSGQTLCIIEAMKLMNEIQSDASGTVAKVFVENGQPVEFGQPLFGIRIG